MIEYDINENGAELHEPIPALEQYPYVDESGKKFPKLICYYAENGQRVFCLETGEVYDKAVEVYPCKLHYYIYEEPIDTEEADNV